MVEDLSRQDLYNLVWSSTIRALAGSWASPTRLTDRTASETRREARKLPHR